jgi:hypothetical protein
LDHRASRQFYGVSNIHELLKAEYGDRLPQHVHLYHERVDQQHDVTPRDEQGIAELGKLEGNLYVVQYAQDPGSMLIGAAFILGGMVINGIIAAFEDKPKPKQLTAPGSPNNGLGERQNQARILGRIPDIYGSVKAYPDLVAHPYIVYENHVEVETCLMCVGRGQYEVNEFFVRDGDTRVSEIPDMSVEIYWPGNIPGSGAPEYTIGEPISDPTYNVYPVKGINGQVLEPYNGRSIMGSINSSRNVFGLGMRFTSPSTGVGIIDIPVIDSETEVTDRLAVGDVCELRFSTNTIARFLSGPRIVDEAISGVGTAPALRDDEAGYTITAISALSAVAPGSGYAGTVAVTLSIPVAKQAAWDSINTFATAPNFFAGTIYNHAAILTPLIGYEGPFFGDDPNMQKIYCNFVADRGLYMDDSHNAKSIDVIIDVHVAPANANGTIAGAWEEFQTTVTGSATQRSTKAVTMVIEPSFTGRFLIRARRNTNTYWRTYQHAQGFLTPVGGTYTGTEQFESEYAPHFGLIEDEIRWSHCYSMSVPLEGSFGSVTLVHARTVNNRRAREVKDRRLNLIVTRMQQTWNGTVFGGAATATEFPEDAFFAICKDNYIGNMADDEIDFTGIADAFQAVRDYFGDNIIDFGYTFDSDDTSLEEMLTVIAENSFCTVYRDGKVIKVKPLIATDEAVLLFNHRNKWPGTEERQINFGNEQQYDGVQIDYTDGTNGDIQTIFLPNYDNSQRPRQIDLVGINSRIRALTIAWRAYNRLRYQNMTVSFKALPEAMLTVVDDRILVSDNTRSVVEDGEIVNVSGLTITCSQEVDLNGEQCTLFLQNPDGSVESMGVTQGANIRELVLPTAPGFTLNDDIANGLRTTYLLVRDNEPAPRAFLLAEKKATTDGMFDLTAYNYAHAYYFNDGLVLWLPYRGTTGFSLSRDWSPYERTTTLSSGFAGSTSGTGRGTVYSCTVSGESITITPGDNNKSVTSYTTYTKACWLRKADSVAGGDILGTPSPSIEEVWIVSASDEMRVLHGGVVQVEVTVPIDEWFHGAVTYDAVAGDIHLYLNGELVDKNLSAAAPGIKNGLVAFENWVGQADDLRLYRRVLSPYEIRELYLRTLNVFDEFN